MQFDEHPDADVIGGHGLPAADHRRAASLAALGQVGVPPHVRRARRLLRPRPAAAGRRVRTRHPGAAMGHLAPREARGRHVGKPADHVSTLKFIERLWGLPTLASRNHGSTRLDSDGLRLRHGWGTRTTARPPRLVERPLRPVPLLSRASGLREHPSRRVGLALSMPGHPIALSRLSSVHRFALR